MCLKKKKQLLPANHQIYTFWFERNVYFTHYLTQSLFQQATINSFILLLQSTSPQTKQQLVQVKSESHECLLISGQRSGGLSQGQDPSKKAPTIQEQHPDDTLTLYT